MSLNLCFVGVVVNETEVSSLCKSTKPYVLTLAADRMRKCDSEESTDMPVQKMS